jgi:hypothetical protein
VARIEHPARLLRYAIITDVWNATVGAASLSNGSDIHDGVYCLGSSEKQSNNDTALEADWL